MTAHCSKSAAEASASLIGAAVNSHASLLKLAETIEAEFRFHTGEIESRLRDQARAAIKLAKADQANADNSNIFL